jgi:hypothetical protein
MSAASARRAASTIPDPSVRILRPEVPEEWRRNATEMAAWTAARLVNRRDVFGHYLPLERRTPKNTAITDKSELTLQVLERHYRGESVGDIVGLHSTGTDLAAGEGEVRSDWSRWGGQDVDRHKDGDDPEANRRFVSDRYDRLVTLGFRPLLIDSDGRGGYHLRVIFNAPTPTADVFEFMKWLREGWDFDGLAEEPETFPKQASLKKGKGIGNWLRLPGRHHTRDHWSRAWNGSEWLDGAAAIGFMTGLVGDSPGLIPHEALHPEDRKFRGSSGRLRAKAPERRDEEDLAREALGYLGHLVSNYKSWLEIGMSLHQFGAAGFRLWENWSQGSSKYQPGICEAKWATFTSGGPGDLTIGYLFKHATDAGWTGFGGRNGQENGRHSRNGNGQHSGRNTPPPPGGKKADPPEADASEDEYAGATEAELGIVDAADVTLENPVWLWDRRFLKGKINLIAGEGGDGKTTVAILVGSTVIQGGTFPDGTPAGPPGVVMILAAEDGAGDTIKPRFIAAGADLSTGKLKFLTARVNIPRRGDRPAMVHPVCLKDTSYWRTIFSRYRPTVLIVDPLPAYLGRGVNDNKNSDVQEALKEFALLAGEFSVCVIAITHTGKATDRKLIHKVLGSVAYTNVARVVHVTIKDPNKPDVRYLERPKCNLDEPVAALAYKLVSAEFEQDGVTYKTSRAEIDPEPVAIDAEAMTNPKREGARGPDPKKEIAIAEWLFDFLDGQAGWTERRHVLSESGKAGLIGTYNPQTKKWSNGTVLYRGKDRIPELKDARANRRVEEQDMRATNDRYPRVCWRLFDQDSPF